MQRTHNPEGQALSSAELFDTHEFVEVPGRTLASLARELGHPRVDLLKFDLEGGEYEVIPQLDLAALQIKVLALRAAPQPRPPRGSAGDRAPRKERLRGGGDQTGGEAHLRAA